jgi:hypothetical protein
VPAPAEIEPGVAIVEPDTDDLEGDGPEPDPAELQQFLLDTAAAKGIAEPGREHV